MEILQQFAATATATATALSPTAAQPMTTAQMEAAIATLHGKKQRLREAYDSLVLSSPIPLPFRWSDLDSHLSSLQSSIHARFSQLQALEASRPAPPAAAISAQAAASHGEESSEDVEMEDVQQQGEDEVMAAAASAKMAPPSTVQVKEEAMEVEVSPTPLCGASGLAAACVSMGAPRLANPAGKHAGFGQDGFVRPGKMAEAAAAAAAKMVPPSTVQVKEEPVEVSPSPPGETRGLTAACASMDAPRLDELVCKRAGGGQDGFARHGTAQSPPIPSCPALQQLHMAGAPNGSYPVLRQHAANAMNADHSVFRPQQHMGKPRDASGLLPQQMAAAPNAGDRLPQQRQQRVDMVNDNLTCPLLPPVVVGPSLPPPPQTPSQARVGVGNLTNPIPPPHLQLVGVANPINAGDLPPQKQQFTANETNTGERPLQERQQQHQQRVGVDAGDLLRQQQQFTVDTQNAGERLLQERQQQKQHLVTAKSTNAACNRPPQRQQQKMARPPNATNMQQPKQDHHQFMADGGTNARNPQQTPCGMANPPNSGDLLTGKLMTNNHSARATVPTPFVASKQSESAAMTKMKNNQNSGGTGQQPVAAGDAPNLAGNQQQQGQRKGGANMRGGRGQGNKNNNIVNTNISNMSKVIGKGNGNPQFNKNGLGDHQKNKNAGQLCYRCGCRGHWSRICRAPEHLVKLYQQGRKAKQRQAAAANTTMWEP